MKVQSVGGQDVHKPKVFVDGQSGTTGLQIYDRIKARSDVEVIHIPNAKRKDNAAKLDCFRQSDLVFLCLPDDSAKETVSLIEAENITAKIIDASTAHRTAPGWTYGFPELRPDFREKIAASRRVANVGCYASGFIAPVKPLIDSNLFPRDHAFAVNAVSGHSGGGRKMIEVFSEKRFGEPHELYHFLQYGLNLNHKHLKEMTVISGLTQPPLLLPAVDYSKQGMLVNIPIHRKYLEAYQTGFDDVFQCLNDYYRGEKYVSVSKWTETPLRNHPQLPYTYLDAVSCNDSNRLEIIVCGGNDTHVNLCSRLDNLGKGASGAAIQNMNLMLGFSEDTSLN